MRRSERHPSLNGESFDSPSRGWRAIGSSRISRPRRAARITISEASSIPVDWRSSTGRTSRLIARRPKPQGQSREGQGQQPEPAQGWEPYLPALKAEPETTVVAPGTKQIKLSDMLGKGPVVVYTFIQAFTAT